MMPGLLLVATVMVATLAFALLAASQQQHWPQLRTFPARHPPVGVRPTGWLLLCLSLMPAILRDGTGFGLILWVMLLPVAAMLVTGLLTLRAGKPRHGTDS